MEFDVLTGSEQTSDYTSGARTPPSRAIQREVESEDLGADQSYATSGYPPEVAQPAPAATALQSSGEQQPVVETRQFSAPLLDWDATRYVLYF